MTEWRKTPYLIQRLSLRNGAPKDPDSFDKLYSCDYMGSAEFEFGALPDSLKEITRNLDSYRIVRVEPKTAAHDGRLLYAVCTDEQEEDLLGFVPQLVDGTLRLKELIYLKEALEEPVPAVVAWWDVSNHWLLVLGEKTAKRTMMALQGLRNRWVKEGKINIS